MTSDRVTQILLSSSTAEGATTDELLPFVYDELRRQARLQLAKEPAGQTLDATGLVHEAYLRLVGSADIEWKNRKHFFAAAARAMRRILVDRARRYRTAKRDGKRLDVSPDLFAGVLGERPDLMLQLDETLARFEAVDQRASEVLQLRYFARLSLEETSRALDLSLATAKRDWSFAKAWLRRELDRDPNTDRPE